MHAMVLKKLGAALEWTEIADRQPAQGQIRVKVTACGVCRTDLHVVDGELPDPKLPIIPGHEIVGRIDAIGAGVENLRIGEQVAKWQGRSVYAFTRPGDVAAQNFARSLGSTWAGGSDEMPPEPLDVAIIFATAGELVPMALKAVRKGGRVVCAGIHMSDIPSFPYGLLWEERQLVSVANLTRQDGIDFLRLAPEIGIVTRTTSYPLREANQALADLRAGRFEGAAVLIP
jgi:propanol-preferring alcohol dehydrogenase